MYNIHINTQNTAEQTEQQSCLSEEDSFQQENETDLEQQFAGFLDNIGQMLEDEPLDESAQKKSRKLALRAKLRGYKKKSENRKSLNVKKLTSNVKRQKQKFSRQIQAKTHTRLREDMHRSSGIFQDITNGSQQKYHSGVQLTKPSEFTLYRNDDILHQTSGLYGQESDLAFEQTADRSIIQKPRQEIPCRPTHIQQPDKSRLVSDNRYYGLAQDAPNFTPYCTDQRIRNQIPISNSGQIYSSKIKENQHNVFPYLRPFGFGKISGDDFSDINGALDQAFVNRHQTSSIYEIAERQIHSPRQQKGSQHNDDTSMSMRVDDEPTATTHKHSGGSTKYKQQNADVLDTNDMSFDLINQNPAPTQEQPFRQ